MRLHDYDLIVAGAGCAGLSFLWHLLEHPAPSPHRVLLVDRTLARRADRLWCFWGDGDLPFQDLACKTWTRMRVTFPGRTIAEPLRRNPYACVRSETYHDAVFARLHQHPHITFLEAEIETIRDEAAGGAVVTSAGTFRAPFVLQSCFLSPADRAAPVHYPLRQHFGGWEVRTERPAFDDRTATLMDFDVDQHGGTAFFYVLPFAPDHALIEFTMFSPHPRGDCFYDAILQDYLDRASLGPYAIERHEYGCIPMEDRLLQQRWGRHVFNLGTVGGMTKPTTGYTFQRIHQQARHLVATLHETGTPQPLPAPPTRFRFYDRLLLHILYHTPEFGRPIFQRLFEHNPIDRVLTFIDERSTPAEDARIFAHLPYAPFLKAVPAGALNRLRPLSSRLRRPNRTPAPLPSNASV